MPGTPDHAVDALLDRAVERLGGARREGQHLMARAVADSLESSQALLVQAGTGTGKSLAYLVPAVHHAVTREARVVVSTATIALQRQVVARDLPVVAEALASELPRAPRTALLKGWQNYVCRNKLEGGYPDDEPALFDVDPGAGSGGPGAGTSDLGAQVLRVRAWAAESTTGDRDDLQPGVSERAWRQVSVTKLECLGSKCRFFDECFPEAARETARQADVVVTNHAMLAVAATGSPGALPEYDAIIVDEAHELADRVTTQATAELSQPAVEHAARLATRHGGLPAVELVEAGVRLGAALEQLEVGRLRGGLPDELALAVSATRDALRGLVTALKPAPGAESQAEAGTKLAQAAVLELFEVAERMLIDPVPGQGDVLWVARSEPERGGTVRLHAAPLAVAGLIAGGLLSERAVVLTSATLTLGGTFEPVARSVGLGATGADEAAPSWQGLDVGSPFDYRNQGIVYVAKHLPEPGREPATDSQLDEIAELVTAAGGRTLGLFSSHRAARAAADAMRERLDVPVLLQGDDQLSTLVTRFAADETSCLFGTLGLWQGVDVPGRACSLVIIDRLPFPRPDDPVRSARSEAADRAGGNGFMQVSATHAALMLAQAAGRLIRTTADRGVVAVLDPRLATRRYGSFLARSMPPMWRTTDRATVTAALRRLAALP